MKKVIVINALSSSYPGSCCNLFKRTNWFKSKLSSKLRIEKELTEEFNKVGAQGFEFEDEKVLPHNLYVENRYLSDSVHGVFRFTRGQVSKYQIYFGPIIEITTDDNKGCSSLGCKGKGCKNTLCCKSKGGNIQYINFLNNEKNQKEVQVLNKHYDLRQSFDKSSDYTYVSVQTESLNEFIKEHYDEIVAKYKQDVATFYQQGMGFIKTIDTPSHTDLLTQAMLFGSQSKRKADMADYSEFSANLTLSRFDVWYFPMIKSIQRRIMEYFHLAKSKDIFGSATISDSNLEIVEKTYEEDFNAQESSELTNRMIAENIIGKIPVTIAIKRKIGFWGRLFRPVEYDFNTYLIDAIEG